MSKLLLKPKHHKMLVDIFDNYCPKAEIWAYGSRLNGDAHSGSDLDLVVKSFNSNDVYLYELKELLAESDIPFMVDIHEFEYLPKSFQEEIERGYEIIYPVSAVNLRG